MVHYSLPQLQESIMTMDCSIRIERQLQRQIIEAFYDLNGMVGPYCREGLHNEPNIFID